MIDLFRFMLLRPAQVVEGDQVKILEPRFVNAQVPLDDKRQRARKFVASGALVTDTSSLTFARVARAVALAAASGPIPAQEVSSTFEEVVGAPLKETVADERFTAERARIEDSLSAMYLLSDSSGADAPGLVELITGYDALERTASGVDPVQLRALCSGDGGPPLPRVQEPPASQTVPDADDGVRAARTRLADLEAAITALISLPASSFASTVREQVNPATLGHVGAFNVSSELQGDKGGLIGSALSGAPWRLGADTVVAMSDTVRTTLSKAGIQPSTVSVPVMLNSLQELRIRELKIIDKVSSVKDETIHAIGRAQAPIESQDYVGLPKAPLPAGHGSVRPVGVGDLLVVKQHILRYQGGDLAHVENVLKSEHISRETRRLERTETTVMVETETTKEEQRDTQSTERFSLKRETSETIKEDSSFKAGVSVDAKYGPMVEVKANADYATSTSTESSAKQAAEFSKDVVSRSASKLVERVLERRSTTTIQEFEEKYSHGFDNTAGAGHISGFYQWIDKVSQAQVYNYGQRLLFDVTLPEPGTNYVLAQNSGSDETRETLKKPPAFTIDASGITEANYTRWASVYGAVGLEAPPAPYRTVSKPIDTAVTQSPWESTKSDTLAIPEGYVAKYAYLTTSGNFHDDTPGVGTRPFWTMIIGTNKLDAWNFFTGYFDMSNEVDAVAITSIAYKIEMLTASIEIFCELTPRGRQAWQLKTHATLTQAYMAKMQAYEQLLAQAKAQEGVVITGRNSGFNTRFVASELRRQCLTLVTAQQFDGFGALELSAEGYAQPNLPRTEQQMAYVRFFEQAFEWEHLVYFCYPYFWGLKKAWHHRMLLDDADPAFADFLRAGAVRVVFPVRPGFREAVVHYLATGKIWSGGPPPNIGDSTYLPIVNEIQAATGAPGDEKPVGKPWPVVLPTTLVQIRPNNDLPTWHEVDGEWEPTN